MELRHLKYFVTVAEELSFSRAAVRLFISQPALSRQIKDLEDELGILLFLRKSHGLILTAAGKFFLEQAKDILNRSHVAVQTIKNNYTNIDEFLVVNCIPTIHQVRNRSGLRIWSKLASLSVGNRRMNRNT